MIFGPRRLRSSLFVLFAVAFVLGGCASSGYQGGDFFYDAPIPNIQWPPPPQKAKITYVGAIREPHQSEIKTSWLRKMLNNLVGAESGVSPLLRPYGVFAVGKKIFVADTGSAMIHIFDTTQKTYLGIRKAGEFDLVSPVGVAVDTDGTLYVSDSVLQRIFVFDERGAYLREIGSADTLRRPAGIALYNERLYVVDTHAHAVVVFAKADGRLLFTFGSQGTETGNFNYPTNICIAKDHRIYITDSMNFRVQVFDPDGAYIGSFGKHGDGTGDFSKPKGIAVDSDDNIYVVDAHFDAVQIFDQQGRVLLAFGSSGKREGEFTLPAGIFIDSSDTIYVTDSFNRRIQIFRYFRESKP